MFHYFLDSKFTLVVEGKDCNRLGSVKECKNGAQSLRLPDTFADRFNDSRYPPFCYYKYVTDEAGKMGLKFNRAAESSIPCSPLRPCLCQVSSKYKQGKYRGARLIVPRIIVQIAYWFKIWWVPIVKMDYSQ